jgi:integrase
MAKLSKRTIDAALPRSGSSYYLWDEQLSGFGVKVLPTGVKRYILKYRAGGGGRAAAQRWLTIGGHGSITCEQARELAKRALFSVASGQDPQAARQQKRQAPRVNDLWARFAADHLPMKKPLTRRDYEAQWETIIGPRLGPKLVSEITGADMDKLHKSLSGAPYRANRTLALCSRMMTLAENWGWRAQNSNPCRHVSKFEERPRTRYLDVDELRSLGAALVDLTRSGRISSQAGNAIKLLLLTGARLNEVLTARWEWIQWDKQIMQLPDSKTGAKPIYLSKGALEVLRQQKTLVGHQAESVFPSRSGAPMVNLAKPWKRVREAAGLPSVRLHDLRHTAASIAVGQGASLAIVGRLLGHNQAQTTLRYAHVAADPALAAAGLISEVVEAALMMQEGGATTA